MSRKRLRTLVLVAALSIGIAVAGCGGDDATSPTDAGTAATTPTGTAESTSTSEIGELDAIEASIKSWLMEGDCDVMTDKFLEEQTFSDDPAEACKTFEAAFSPPAYGEDDIEITDVSYENEKATATVGGGPDGISVTAGGEEVTSTYKLVYEDGTWKIDSAALD